MLRQVTKEEFYKAIGDKDLIVSVHGDYPYITRFLERRSNSEFGHEVGKKHGKQGDYYIVDKEDEYIN